MKLPIGQQTRDVNGIQERGAHEGHGGHLYFGFILGDSANGTTLRKYYSYAELRAIPGNLDELCEVVATYDWAQTTKEFIQSDLHAYWTERSLYEAELCSQIKAALQEPPPCTSIVLWRPTLEVVPAMLAIPAERGGIKLVECAHVNIVLRLPEREAA